MAGPAHLVRRFLGSLSPRPLAPADDRWARSQLTVGEQQLWDRLSAPDRKHAAGVARDVERRLGADAARPVLAAALLHDVGKLDSGLGTFGRVAATVIVGALGRSRVTSWSDAAGRRGRLGRYANHPQRGARLLAQAGADPLTVCWAAEHHRPEHDWSVPSHIGRALRDADDD